MADTIIRLKVESQEYEGKIKRAVQGMQQLEKHVRDMGAGFEVAEKADLEFVRALGQMETKATSNTGKLAELKSAFVELSVQYKNLSSAEKKGEFGVALNQSLGQLKGRIDDLGSQIKEANTDINGMGGILDAVAGKIGIPVELFTKMGVAVAAVGAALKVATDAFKQNEELMDGWGRLTQSTTSLYEGFLIALNTGDIGGYLTRMDEIVNAARAAYDAMDELGTFNAFNQINKQRARTNFEDALNNFREGSGTQQEALDAKNALIAELEIQKQKEQDAYKKAVLGIASKYKGVNGEELYTLLSSGKYTDYEAIKGMMPSKVVTDRRYLQDATGMTTVVENTYTTFANETEALGAMLRMFTDEHLNQLQSLGAQAQQTAREIESVERMYLRVGKSGGNGRGSIVNADEVLPEGSVAAIRKRISELNKSLEMAGDQNTRDKIRYQINDLRAELKEMTDSPLFGQNSQVIPLSVELLDTSTEQLTEEVNALREKLGMEPITIDVKTNTDGSVVKTAKSTEQAWESAAKAITSVGSALQQIEDPGAKVAGIVMEAVANIALGFSSASAQSAAGGPIAWVAATISGLAVALSTIASIKSVTKGFADGGMVDGNSYSGDNIVARLNSGEGVLTAAGVRNAAAMASGAKPYANLTATIDGSTILLSASNYARSINKNGGLGFGGNSIALPIID